VQFSELEKIMSQRGISTLADIASALNTTSQAVSNWKHSNHVPSHIITKLEEITFVGNSSVENSKSSISNASGQPAPLSYIGNVTPLFDKEAISIFKFLNTIAEQLKVIVLVTFITVFLVSTYVQFIQSPKYSSSASVFLNSFSKYIHDSVVMPPNITLYPELFRSQIFTERMMDKEFYTDKFGKKMSLLAILTHGDKPSKSGREILIPQAAAVLKGQYLKITQGKRPEVLIVNVTAPEPGFAKELTEAVLVEVEVLHRSFTEDVLNGKINYVEGRVASAKEAAEDLKQSVKEFNERNKLTLTPLLKREYDVLIEKMRVREQSYLGLKRKQLELTYVKSTFLQRSVMEVIDRPEVNLSPSNKDLKRKVLLAGIFGVGLGVLIGFVSSYLRDQYNDDTDAFKKLRYLIKQKPKDIILDWRVSGIVSVFLLAGSPYYLGFVSESPVFFGRYSSALMVVNIIYIMALLTSICLSIYLYRKSIR
jgi:uncharacterized protein involved in exopolysaccharide biosynthesis